MIKNNLVIRLGLVLIFILLIPILPIIIIFSGRTSPEYVMYGTLNVNVKGSLSFFEVYYRFLNNLISFDLGNSISTNQPVIDEINIALNNSFLIIVIAIIFTLVLGPLFSYLKTNFKIFNNYIKKIEFIFYIPIIVFTYLFIFFLDNLGLNILGNLKFILAGIILSIYPTFVVFSSLTDLTIKLKKTNIFNNYVSLGFHPNKILMKYFRKFYLIEILSYLENLIVYMFGFIFFVETPLGINGFGYKFVLAIQRYDYPLIIGLCIFSFLFFSILNLLIESIKSVIDPRTLKNE
ncbi:MAG: ABC transporter permease subunit [Rhodothermaceae bacterium]